MTVELKNDYLTVQINEAGAELSSVKSNEGLEYMWQANPKYWGRHAPVLFPFVGRLKDDQFTVAGQSYPMGQHGFARDHDFRVVKQTATSATLELTDSAETRKVYPFAFRLRLIYTLTDHELTIGYDVHNPANQDLLFSIGGHPAFNVPLDAPEGDLANYQVTVAPKKVYQHIPLQAPYNDIDNSTDLDLTKPLPLTRDLFKDDAVILNLDHEETTLLLSSDLNDHGVAMTIEDAPYVGMWSPYPKDAPFVCLEPWWGIADNVNHDGQLSHKMGINKLAPNQTFDAKYAVKFF
ncbi:galactose mutarotase [Lactobacillus sp.] [Lactiplantibacillus mudanjiangensis]|uniref:aldose 1-epimerase family protein n=1 Tax=Lactiplantibacillus mudanjiangensis TaxID=1296538 RepID=UPI001014EE05|nr:aldose 1-epimerase family protein [Lactiplantibacillus mudanjiangensis]VDG30785.1 galactose mutarotase [Lactobacillus sp.] [Lactiplantibacillus mudanjiangensis]